MVLFQNAGNRTPDVARMANNLLKVFMSISRDDSIVKDLQELRVAAGHFIECERPRTTHGFLDERIGLHEKIRRWRVP